MPRPNAADYLDLEIERQAEEIVEALIRRAQEKVAAQARPKTDSAGQSNVIEEMVALATLEPLNQYELISIKALVAYIAHTQRLSPESIHGLLDVKFDAASIEEIKRQDYHRIVEYLVNLQDSGSMN